MTTFDTNRAQTIDDLIALDDAELATLSPEVMGKAIVHTMVINELRDVTDEEVIEGAQFILDSETGKRLAMQMTVGVQTDINGSVLNSLVELLDNETTQRGSFRTELVKLRPGIIRSVLVSYRRMITEPQT